MILAPGSRAGAQVMEKAVKGRSLWDDARRRLLRNGAAVSGMVVLAILVLVAIIGPHLVPFSYDQINKDDVWAPPMTAVPATSTSDGVRSSAAADSSKRITRNQNATMNGVVAR